MRGIWCNTRVTSSTTSLRTTLSENVPYCALQLEVDSSFKLFKLPMSTANVKALFAVTCFY